VRVAPSQAESLEHPGQRQRDAVPQVVQGIRQDGQAAREQAAHQLNEGKAGIEQKGDLDVGSAVCRAMMNVSMAVPVCVIVRHRCPHSQRYLALDYPATDRLCQTKRPMPKATLPCARTEWPVWPQPTMPREELGWPAHTPQPVRQRPVAAAAHGRRGIRNACRNGGGSAR